MKRRASGEKPLPTKPEKPEIVVRNPEQKPNFDLSWDQSTPQQSNGHVEHESYSNVSVALVLLDIHLYSG